MEGWDGSSVVDVLGVVEMQASRRSESAAVGDILGDVTTREVAKRLIDELPESEVEPVVDFIVSRRAPDPDLEALLDEEEDEMLAEMDAREEAAARRASKA